KRIDLADCRLAPSDELRAGAGLAARRIHQLRVFAGIAGRADQRLGPRLDLAGDLAAPAAAVGRDLPGDLRPLDADELPPLGKESGDPRRKPADPAADDQRDRLELAVVGALVDVIAGGAFRHPGPQIAFPAADPHKAQIVEPDIAVMAALDVPEQHR